MLSFQDVGKKIPLIYYKKSKSPEFSNTINDTKRECSLGWVIIVYKFLPIKICPNYQQVYEH
jgi:hypothetical protein